MSVWQQNDCASSPLRGEEGDLYLIEIAVSPKRIEELLETLAGLPFAINPELRYEGDQTLVTFPAFEPHLDPVRRCLGSVRFPVDAFISRTCLAAAG